MDSIKLIALDLDGTLFDSRSQISQENIDTIKKACQAGVNVVISTGRPFIGVPFEKLKGTGINYAITTNGAAIYEISTGKCIYQDSMSQELALNAINYILSKDVHMDAFIEGKAYSPLKCLEVGQRLAIRPELKAYILGESRVRVEDLPEFIIANNYTVQKCTLNFANDEKGEPISREDIRQFLEAQNMYDIVSGGFNNLEFTKKGVDKGVGLNHLSKHLGISIEQTMAIGDTENDLSILEAASIGVAMGNATPDLKEKADYVTLTNDEDGVAAAIKHFIPFLK